MSNTAFIAGDVVVTGTLDRTVLIREFASALRYAAIGAHIDPVRRTVLQQADSWLRRDANAGWSDSIAAEHDCYGDELVSELIEFLNALAPDGCYFGAHEGDGACFGFWQID